MPAARLEPLIANAEAFRQHKEDRFKVWPTNRDRACLDLHPPAMYSIIGIAAPRSWSAQADEGCDSLATGLPHPGRLFAGAEFDVRVACSVLAGGSIEGFRVGLQFTHATPRAKDAVVSLLARL